MCKRSSQQSHQSCFSTNTRTTHTRQNKPYRLSAVRAAVVGAQGRCCPAATVPVAVVFPCGVCCCIAENIQNKIINRKTEQSAIIVHKPKRTATSTRTTHTRQNKPYRLGEAPAGLAGPRGRGCPAVTVPVAVVIARVVCCCIAQKSKKKNNQHQVSPFYSKLNIFREGLVSEKRECSPNSGSSPHILGSSPHAKIKENKSEFWNSTILARLSPT